MVTIKKMAELAGVSPTTVSNVLHGRTAKVSDVKLKRVQEIIEQTHYMPNMGGQLLAGNGSRIIGVIMFYEHRKELNVTQDPFHSELIGALEAAIRENGYFMLLYTAKNYDEAIRVSSAWNIEGLIFLGSSPADAKNIIRSSEIPTVFIDTYIYEDNPKFYNVGLADFAGGRRLGNYLFEQGMKKIAFLANARAPIGVDLERLNGLQAAYEENGRKFATTDFIYLSHQEAKRHESLRELVKSGELLKFDALFFASDFYAVDSMNLLFDLGLRVPEDISVVGFDNNLLAQQSRPRLTTMKQNVSEKGQAAIDLVMRLIRKEEIPESNIMLPVELVQRDSVQNPQLPKADNS